ncbi:uncharacterized protein LOC111257768 [Setaria italica]|uniref:uncharacterized protein LOC111257768 n=1 Tax=Setaria italica TaxID=4555 RepID=UPI000BE615E8|nr:uncharacterized protein LOC111257768 [Setaria italica]
MAYVLPARFYDRVDEGSIVLKRCDSFGFRADGLVLDGTGERVDADVVILATGFDIDRLLSSVRVAMVPRDHRRGAFRRHASSLQCGHQIDCCSVNGHTHICAVETLRRRTNTSQNAWQLVFVWRSINSWVLWVGCPRLDPDN